MLHIVQVSFKRLKSRIVLEHEPTQPDANHNLGLILVAMHQIEDALVLFKVAVEAEPGIEQLWISYIDALIELELFGEAAQALEKGSESGLSENTLTDLGRRLVSQKSGQAPSRLQSAKLLAQYRNGQYTEAETSAISMTDQFPEHQFGWKVLGAVFKQLGKISAALSANQRAVEIDPHDAEGHSNLGLILEELGLSNEAELSFKKAITIKASFAEAYGNLGITLRTLERFEEAEEEFVKSLSIKPNNVEVVRLLADTLRNLGKLEKAEAGYLESIKLRPDYPEAHNNLGVTLDALGRSDEAESSYRKAIALKPNYPEAFNNLGNVLKILEKFGEAEVCFQEAIALKADYFEAYNNLGNLFNQLGNLVEAERNYKKAIKMKPDFSLGLFNLGNVLKNSGRLAEAKESYNAALALSPSFAEAHFNLGFIMLKVGNLQQSEASLRKAVTLLPDYKEAIYLLGATLKELGRVEEALGCFEKALSIEAEFPEARYELGLIFFESGNYSEAMAQFKLVDVVKSKEYEMRCAYILDQRSVFYEGINSLIHQGRINAVIGSLICQANLRYGMNLPNLYCNEPLNYILKTDLNKRYDFKDKFVEAAKSVLKNDMQSYKAQGILTNGHQTAGNIFTLENPLIIQVESIIRVEIERYRSQFIKSGEGLIKRWPAFYEIYGWFVSLISGGSLSAHMHENGWLSGSVYINVPSGLLEDSGNLVVSIDDAAEENKNNSKSIEVATGDLCLFPASLLHYTVPFEATEERIVLAFDIIPK